MIRLAAPVVRTLLAAAALLLFASAVIALSGGGAIELGFVVIRSHNPYRPAIAALVALLVAIMGGITAVRSALEWWWNTAERFASHGAVLAAAGSSARWAVNAV